jgi:hypothetical protein
VRDTFLGEPLVRDTFLGEPLVRDTFLGEPLVRDTLLGEPHGDRSPDRELLDESHCYTSSSVSAGRMSPAVVSSVSAPADSWTSPPSAAD